MTMWSLLLFFGDCAESLSFAEPARIEKTAGYREAVQLSERISSLHTEDRRKVAVIGGGLSGLACAKYLSDAGHEVSVYEARDTLGGKVSAWQDKDGDWIETGLHIFFGAYPNMLRLFAELDIRDRLQWKAHRMTFALRGEAGEYTSFEFPDGVPAPFNMASAILGNRDMLTFIEKVRLVPGLLPMLVQGQSYIDAQDDLSVGEWMKRYNVPRRVLDEVFEAMGKALDFIDAEELSMAVILTAMNRFINEADGSQTAFLDGNQPDRLCRPIADHVEARGGSVFTKQPVAEIVVDDSGAVEMLRMADGSNVVADEYVSAVPVDVFKKLVPRPWKKMAFFNQLDHLQGIPVINVQLWFEDKLGDSIDGLVFSRSECLSVFADMSKSCEEYRDDASSMLSLVFAPIKTKEKNWLKESDRAVVDETLAELRNLFPNQPLRLKKFAVVRTPRSVYAAIPGRNRFRPSQRTPIDNFVLAGDYTSQRFLGSMEGAVLAGKLAADVVAKRASGHSPLPPIKLPEEDRRMTAVEDSSRFGEDDVLAAHATATSSSSWKDKGAIAYGGGECNIRP